MIIKAKGNLEQKTEQVKRPVRQWAPLALCQGERGSLGGSHSTVQTPPPAHRGSRFKRSLSQVSIGFLRHEVIKLLDRLAWSPLVSEGESKLNACVGLCCSLHVSYTIRTLVHGLFQHPLSTWTPPTLVPSTAFLHFFSQPFVCFCEKLPLSTLLPLVSFWYLLFPTTALFWSNVVFLLRLGAITVLFFPPIFSISSFLHSLYPVSYSPFSGPSPFCQVFTPLGLARHSCPQVPFFFLIFFSFFLCIMF